MHADHRNRLHRDRPVDVLQMDHRMAAMGVALAARRHARLAADAAIRIDEELQVRRDGHRHFPCCTEVRAASSAPPLVTFVSSPPGSSVAASPGGFSDFLMRTAQTLNSGIFETGSCAEMVNWLADLRPGQ